jgi:hypothetical protein
LKILTALYLRTVTKSSPSSANSNSPINDFGKCLALIIGVPTAVCVAAYLVYRQQQEQAKKSVTTLLKKRYFIESKKGLLADTREDPFLVSYNGYFSVLN